MLGGGTTFIYALQIVGVPATEFVADMSDTSSSATKTTMSGKDVYADPSGPIVTVFYPKDDMLFIILASATAAPGHPGRAALTVRAAGPPTDSTEPRPGPPAGAPSLRGAARSPSRES